MLSSNKGNHLLSSIVQLLSLGMASANQNTAPGVKFGSRSSVTASNMGSGSPSRERRPLFPPAPAIASVEEGDLTQPRAPFAADGAGPSVSLPSSSHSTNSTDEEGSINRSDSSSLLHQYAAVQEVHRIPVRPRLQVIGNNSNHPADNAFLKYIRWFYKLTLQFCSRSQPTSRSINTPCSNTIPSISL